MLFRVYHMVFQNDKDEFKEYFTTSRSSVVRIANNQLNTTKKIHAFDNYIRKSNLLPSGLILLEMYDAYDYFRDEAYKTYGSMNGLCSKTIHGKYSKIIETQFANPQSNFVR